MSAPGAGRLRARRRLLQGAGLFAIAPWLRARAQQRELPSIAALSGFLAGRSLRWERLRLDLPRLADNGLVVPVKIAVVGPFAPGPHVSAIHLFSEINPVPQMAVFEFPVPLERIELESRVRLAGTQRIVAIATMSDGVLFADVAEVVVTLAGCMDGT
jgi:sulfur-oxidizing protein SoxY